MRPVRAVGIVTAALGAVTIASACSSSTTLGSSDAGTTGAGTSGLVTRPDANPEPGPAARGALASTLRPSSEPRGSCPVDGPYVALGTLDPSAPVEDGAMVNGLEARVYCRVIPTDATGTTFDVHGSITFDAKGSPSTNIDGTIRASGSSRIVFSVGKASDTYASNECDFTFNKAAHGIAPGRIWGEVTCYRAETIAFDDKLCSVNAELRFENCRMKE